MPRARTSRVNWDEGQAEQPEGLDITNSITNAAAEVSTLQIDGQRMVFGPC